MSVEPEKIDTDNPAPEEGAGRSRLIDDMTAEQLAHFLPGTLELLRSLAKEAVLAEAEREQAERNSPTGDLGRKKSPGGEGGSAPLQDTKPLASEGGNTVCNTGYGSLYSLQSQFEFLTESISVRMTLAEYLYLKEESGKSGAAMGKLIRFGIQAMRDRKTVQYVVHQLQWDEEVPKLLSRASAAAQSILKGVAAYKGIASISDDLTRREEGKTLYFSVLGCVSELRRLNRLLGALTWEDVKILQHLREEIMDEAKESTLTLSQRAALNRLADGLKALGFVEE